MSRIERYNFILPETSIAHCIRCFIVDCSLYFSTICYVILSKSILQSFLPHRPPCGRAYRSEQDSLASRLRVQKYNKLPLPPNNPAEKFSKKLQHRNFDASIWQKSLISPIFRPSPLPPAFCPFLPRCASKSHKTASETNPTNSEVVFSISEVEKITSEVNRTTSEVDQIIPEEVIKSSRRWTKPPPSFNTKPKKQRSPTLLAFLAHACAHYARTLHYNPMFFAFTAFTIHRKTPRNRLIRLYDLCFSTLPFTIFLHLCLHPYSPDFQPLSPIGEGVKAICTHYYSVYARRSAGGYLSTETNPFRERSSGEAKQCKC